MLTSALKKERNDNEHTLPASPVYVCIQMMPEPVVQRYFERISDTVHPRDLSMMDQHQTAVLIPDCEVYSRAEWPASRTCYIPLCNHKIDTAAVGETKPMQNAVCHKVVSLMICMGYTRITYLHKRHLFMTRVIKIRNEVIAEMVNVMTSSTNRVSCSKKC